VSRSELDCSLDDSGGGVWGYLFPEEVHASDWRGRNLLEAVDSGELSHDQVQQFLEEKQKCGPGHWSLVSALWSLVPGSAPCSKEWGRKKVKTGGEDDEETGDDGLSTNTNVY